MDISGQRRRKREENVIPMINVVFLLLIFFLMTAQIAPPEPFEVAPPASSSITPAEGTFTLYVNAEGEVGFRDALGQDAALEALEQAVRESCAGGLCDDPENRPVVIIRADGQLDATRLPALLRQLAARDMTRVQLATVESIEAEQ